jgi:hypothetical protein
MDLIAAIFIRTIYLIYEFINFYRKSIYRVYKVPYYTNTEKIKKILKIGLTCLFSILTVIYCHYYTQM